MILSLQGGMAAGKTTAVKYVEQHLPQFYVSYENPMPAFTEAQRRGLDQNTCEGFIETQKLFIQSEIERWKENRQKDYVLLDLGPEEIEFFTLFYPKSMGVDWNVKALLQTELQNLKKCRSDGVLFLDCSTDTLIRHRENDPIRKRGFFDHYLPHMHSIKRAWFLSNPDISCEILTIDHLSEDEVGQAVVQWIKKRTSAV